MPRSRCLAGLGGLLKKRQVTVYRPNEEEPTIYKDGEFLESFPELPGFRCAVADLFV